MGVLDWLFGSKVPGSPEGRAYPWDRGPSVYEHIQAHIRAGEAGLGKGGETLPDEERVFDTSKLRWSSGAMDGVATHHMGSTDSDAGARLLKLVKRFCASPTARNKHRVYEFLLRSQVVGLIDPFLERLRTARLDGRRLHDLARSLATQAPDREPVKFGIAVLGLFGREEDTEVFRTLGRHDEFVFYCAVAVGNSGRNVERQLWAMARHVHGWGRVHLVERLERAQDPEVRDWLLREGYKNSVMYEYLAYPCAVGGGLLAALSQEDVDPDLLRSTAEIIQALISGEPAKGIDDYEDGAAVSQLFLDHVEARGTGLAEFLAVAAIRRFLREEDADWPARERRGWTPERRQRLLTQCSALISQPYWRDRALRGLRSQDEDEFNDADRAASELGLDAWPDHWRRLLERPLVPGHWFHVMRECTAARIANVVELAEATLPLERIAIGPGDAMGLGPGFEPHGCLDFILQDLGRFPGNGARLLKAGLRSPVVRNRNMALKALDQWGKAHWPPDMIPVLQEVLQREPNEDVRRRIGSALAGKPLEEREAT